MNRKQKLASSLRQPVPSWAFLVVVVGLIVSTLFGYINIDGNTKSLRTIVGNNAAKSDKRDTELCDVAQFLQDIRAFVPKRYLPKMRADIDKYLKDINKDKAECHPKPPKELRPRPHPSKGANSPVPQVTVTRTIVTPEGTRTIRVTPPPPKKKHHKKSPKPKSILCMLPTPVSPVPPIGGC